MHRSPGWVAAALSAVGLVQACGAGPRLPGPVAATAAAPAAAAGSGAAADDDDCDCNCDRDWDVSDDADWLPTALVARVRARFRALEQAGDLPESVWALDGAPPASDRYARIDLHDDHAHGVYDGFAITAWVRLGADGAPTEDFYLERAGGIAGWQFFAGPYSVRG